MLSSNNFTLSLKSMAHKKNSCVHLGTFPKQITHFPCENHIGSQLPFFLNIFFFPRHITQATGKRQMHGHDHIN